MRSPIRWFWFLNIMLLILYAWTLSERISIVVERVDGSCTAVLMDRHSTIPCPNLEGGSLSLYQESLPRIDLSDAIERGPLDWLVPRSVWQNLRGYKESLPQAFKIEAELLRPDAPARLVFLEPDGRSGWLFVVSDEQRRGSWYRLEEGHPAEAIKGIPLEKSFLTQSQSLLRHMLRVHHGALLLLAMGWLLVKALNKIPNWPFPFIRTRLLGYRIPTRAAVLAAILFSFWATVFIANDVLERLPHVQDSVTYHFQAQTLARGRLWAPEPPLPSFFEQEFLLVEDGRWIGKYPPGYPALLAIGVRSSQPWLINPFLAALTVALLFKLGEALYDRRVGLGAALLAAVSPFFLFMSGSMMAHTAELFWITLFLLLWVWALKRARGNLWAFLAGLALGLAFLTRQPAAIAVGIPFIAITTLAALRKDRLRLAICRIGFLMIAMLPLIALLFIYQVAITGHPFEDPRQLYWPFDRMGFGDEIGMDENAFTVENLDGFPSTSWYDDPSQPPRGHSLARGLYNTEKNWLSLEINLFGWLPLFTLTFCCLAFVARRPNWTDVSLLAIAVGLIGFYSAYWSAGTSYGPRYYYAALPAFLLLTVRGIQAAAARIASGRRNTESHRVDLGAQTGKLVVVALVVAFVLGSLLFSLPNFFDWYRGYNFIDRPSLELPEKHQEKGAILFINVTNKNNWWEYGRYFSSNTPWLDGPIIYARDLGDQENAHLLALYPKYQAYRISGDQVISLTQ